MFLCMKHLCFLKDDSQPGSMKVGVYFKFPHHPTPVVYLYQFFLTIIISLPYTFPIKSSKQLLCQIMFMLSKL